VGTLDSASFRLDPLSSLMILVDHRHRHADSPYSTAYMHDETTGVRALLLVPELFARSCSCWCSGASFPVMFIGWRGVGLCSYLLIGFWFTKPSAPTPARKLHRQPHRRLRFILACCCVSRFGTLDFQGVAGRVPRRLGGRG
jgi:NADH-quinone oxidoreductase subunit L